MTISLRNCSFVLLLLSVIAYPINYSAGGLRILDILFFLSVLVSLPFLTLKRSNLLLVSFFFLVFLISILSGFVLIGDFNNERLIFVYKYFYPFALILIFYNLDLDHTQLNTLLKCMLASHVALVVWVFVYTYLVATGQLYGSFRPSFPFSNDYIASDAHLYSSVLAIGSLFFTMFFKHMYSSKIVFLIFVLISLTAMLLTGSRTGILVYMIGMSMYLISTDKRFSSAIFTLICVSTLTSIVIIFSDIQIPDEYVRLVDRITSTDLSNDSSVLGRIQKLAIGLADSERSYFFIGTGVLHSSLIWYDSLAGSLMSHVGLLGCTIFFLILYKLRKNTVHSGLKNKKKATMFTILLICYVTANLITEYFLVSRSVFPFLVYLFILHQYVKLENYDSKYWKNDDSVVVRKDNVVTAVY